MNKLWLMLLAGLLALASCAGPAETGAPPGGTGASKVDLNFTVATVDGGTFEGKTLAGKPAVLWFWAPWCPTCAAEAPDVAQAASKYQGKVTVIGVAGLDGVPNMQWFVSSFKVDNFPHLADTEGVMWKRFGITAQSTFAVLDANGTITYRGYLDAAGLDSRLAGLAG